MKRIIIVDRYPLIRAALKHLLSAKNHNVLADTGCTREALRFVAQMNPDIVIIDAETGSSDATCLIKRMRDTGYQGNIVVLTAQENSNEFKRCAAAGANMYLSKRCELEFISSIINCLRCPGDSGKTEAAFPEADDTDPLKHLTSGERRLLFLLSSGENLLRIASRLNVSQHTVIARMRELDEKLKFSCYSELIRSAINPQNDT